jgi:hypothetical protein
MTSLWEAVLFCPNCGTKNPETATTCIKCGFNIKGSAAPKFKGTMLMMNQSVPQKPGPVAQPVPAAQPPPAGKPPAVAATVLGPAAAPAPAARPAFKGTMVGVAPPAGFPFGPPGPAAPPAGPQPGAPAPGYGMSAPGGYSPPTHPQDYGTPGPAPPHPGGVNPLGGTVALDQVPAGYAASPAGQGAAAPPPQAPAYGPPPQGGQAWGPPPGAGGFGGAQAGYGPPPGAGYGQPSPGFGGGPAPYGGYGGPTDAAMMPSPNAALAPTSYPPATAAGREHIRNPLVATLLCYVTCGVYAIVLMYSLMAELKAYLNREEIVPWHVLVPILNLIVILTKLPAWVTEAKQRAGSRNPMSSGALLYFLLLPYFFTKDMNEVWDPTTSGG